MSRFSVHPHEAALAGERTDRIAALYERIGYPGTAKRAAWAEAQRARQGASEEAKTAPLLVGAALFDDTVIRGERWIEVAQQAGRSRCQMRVADYYGVPVVFLRHFGSRGAPLRWHRVGLQLSDLRAECVLVPKED